MKMRFAVMLLCVMFLFGCAAPPLQEVDVPGQSEAAPTEAPQAKGVEVFQGSSYRPLDMPEQEDMAWLRAYRALPAAYDDAALQAALSALPPLYIETPQSGSEKFYMRDDPARRGYLTSGTLTYADLQALAAGIKSAQKGQVLQDVLSPFGLAYENPGMDMAFALPVYDEHTDAPYVAELEALHEQVLIMNVTPSDFYRRQLYQLLFQKEGDLYRFAAMVLPSVDSGARDDRVIGEQGGYYVVCGCDTGWGTGVYTKNATVVSLREGEYAHVFYQLDGYDSMWEICENLAIREPILERTAHGGLHFTLQGAFSYEGLSVFDSDTYMDEIFQTLQGTCTFHVYDDADGRGFYTYAEDMGTSFYLNQSAALQAALKARIALMMQAENEEISLFAENFLWTINATLDALPLAARNACNTQQQASAETVYTPALGTQKFYIGNAPVASGSGTLTAQALSGLEQALLDVQTPVEAAIGDAGLLLPDGFSLQDTAPGVEREVLHHQQGDAHIVELRMQDAYDPYYVQSCSLLFLKQADTYAFITAVNRTTSVGADEDEHGPYLTRIAGTYYLHTREWAQEEDGVDTFTQDVWVPFEKEGTATRLRLSGGCALGNEAGRSLHFYWNDITYHAYTEGMPVMKAVIYYYHYPTSISFRIPIELYHDGEGFYSLDANTRHSVSDVLAVPYAKEQIQGQLSIQANCMKRYHRAMAIEFLERVGE